MRIFGIVAAAVLVAGVPLEAGKVKTWRQDSLAHYEKAKLSKTVASNQGVVRLSRELRLLATLDAGHVWDLIEDADGSLIAALGGDEGKLVRVRADGKTETLFEAKDQQVLSVVRGPGGAVHAGLGPSGRIVRVVGGKVETVAEGLGKYVWALAYDAEAKSLYAGVGPKGEIRRIGPDGKAELHYATKQDHVLSLALAGGKLYAGVDKGGLVYRVDGPGKAFVVFHATQNEVRTLHVADGIVYAGTSSPASKRLPLGGLRPSGPPLLPPSTGGAPPTGTGATKTQSGGGPGGPLGGDEPKGSPAPAPTSAAPGENSLYRVGPDGSVRELFRDKTLVLKVLRHQGRLLLGTGMQGQLFEVDEATKERAEIARLDHGQIHCLLPRADGSVVVGTGDPGKIYVLENRYAASGTVLSEPLDAKLSAAWGAIAFKAETPAGTSVRMAVRSGNVPEPDDTWSAWSPEQADPEAAKALAPPARYLQLRTTLTTTDPKVTPEVRQVAVRYRTHNQAPEIGSLDVPDLDVAAVDGPKRFKIRWTATDPNEDELVYSVHVRKDGWKDWVLLDENLEKREYDWDIATTPSGVYQVKVSASDKRDNAPEETFVASRVSAPTVVSHLPPSATLKLAGVQGGKATFDASATDPLVRLVDASFSVDGKRWVSVFPADGLFDSKSERFRFETESLRPGTHVLLFRVRDAAGNAGTADAVFTTP